jgi:hypothetical protein
VNVTALLARRPLALDRVQPRLAVTKYRMALACVLAIAASTRAIWAILAAPVPESDFLTFFQTAQAIAHGQWSPEAYGWSWQGPGYPLLIAPLTLLGSATMPAIHALNVALGVLAVWLTYRLATSLFGSTAGLIAGGVAATYPGLWLWTPILSAENLSAPIFLAIALLILDGRSAGHLIVLGLLTGSLVFVRPSALFFVVVVVASLIWLAPAGAKARTTSLFLVGLILVMGTVVTLNMRSGGPALPLGASGWQPWLVYNEHATGAWFPAQDRDDYPFRGLESDPRLADLVRGGQAKLALEFAVVNPDRVLPSIARRHNFNWARDDAALDWTARRPDSRPLAAAMSSVLDGLLSGSYALILAFAFIGLWMLGSRLSIVLVLILPIAYLSAPAAIAEGNARYHVNGLGYLIALAAAAVATQSKSQRRAMALVAAAIVVLTLMSPGLNPVLIVAILAVGAARLALELIRAIRARLATSAGRRRVLFTAVTAVVCGQLLLTLAFMSIRQTSIDWSIARPDGWTTYRSASDVPGTVVLRPSDASSSMRTVSFAEAALLPVHDGGGGDSHAGLARTFPALSPGGRYVIYLQISDPIGQAEGRLRVLANGRTVWDMAEHDQSSNGWQYVIVPWSADSPFLFLQVDRESVTPGASEVLVRSVHLYPKY